MSDVRTVRLGAGGIEEVDDPLLIELDRQEEDYARELGLMGPARATEPDGPRPFDVEVPRPRAVSLERLYQLTNEELPPEIRAASSSRMPLLVHQGLTAFNPPGRAPASVWGLGYRIELQAPDASTVAVQPGTELLDVAEIDQDVGLSLGVGGGLEVAPQVVELANAIPGIALEGVKIGASTEQSLSLTILFKVQLLKVEAGPVGAGGARWNMYRQDEQLAGFQPLLHTILVPRETASLTATVQTWVVRAGRWFGLKKPVKWISEEAEFEVPVDGV